MDWHKQRKGQTHYPVPDNFTVGRRAGQKTSEVTKVLYLRTSMQWTLVAVDENQGCESRIKLPVSTGLYIMACALKLPVYCCEADSGQVTGTSYWMWSPPRTVGCCQSTVLERDFNLGWGLNVPRF